MAPGDSAALGTPDGRSSRLPHGTVFEPDASIEWFGDDVVAGGSPWRLIRLTERGGRALRSWIAGSSLGDDPAEARLARRLVNAGMLRPVLAPRLPPAGDVDVIVPVFDDRRGLDALLASLGASVARLVTVVDDGSSDPSALQSVAAAHGARVIRREHRGGPGAARNSGLAATAAPIVAFLDADVVASHSTLTTLYAQFDDPLLAAVAPRVRGPRGGGALARFERAASPLDLGPSPGVVRPGAAVAYLPAAALMCRRTALASGFDESFLVGEDVDLVWRLVEDGWLVRYVPTIEVAHPARATMTAWLAQRVAYGRSAAALEARHGDAAAPLRADLRVVATVGLVLAGRPRAAAAVLATTAASLGRQLADAGVPVGTGAARRLALRGTAFAIPGLARSMLRSYAPLVLVAVAARPLRRTALTVAVIATATRWSRAGRPRPIAEFAALSVLDDLAYGAGVLQGAIRTRRAGALVPRLRTSARRASRT